MKLLLRIPCVFLIIPVFMILISPFTSRAEGVAEGVTAGVILPLSGTHAAFGHMQKNSMLMAVEEINARGGIGGEALKLDIRDSGGQPGDARAIIDHFVRDKQYPVVLGGFSSSVAAALADKCEQRRIPLVVVTGSEDAITLEENRYVFRVSPPRSRYPLAAMEYINSVFDKARIVLITERSSYGESMAATVNQAVRESKWYLAGEWDFDLGSWNFETLLAAAKAVEPEVVILAAFPPEGTRVIREIREAVPTAAVFNLTPASSMGGSYTQCGAACSSVFNPSLWLPAAAKSGVRYRDKYLARFESEPDYHGAQAYGAVIVAAQAMRRSGIVQPETVRDALESIAANTPYGRISFRDWGGFFNQNDPESYLFQWTGNSYEVVWPQQYKTAEPVLPERP